MIHNNLVIQKLYAQNRSSATFRGKVLVSWYRKTSWGNAFVFQKFSSTEKNMDRKGVSRFSVEIFLSQIAQKATWANPSVFQKNSGIKSFSIIGLSQLCRIFCLTSPKIFVGEPNPSVFQEYSGIKMFRIIGVSRFCRSFLSHSTEKFRRGIFVFPKTSGIEKLLDNKVARFCRLFLSHSAEKFVENPPMIQKN